MAPGPFPIPAVRSPDTTTRLVLWGAAACALIAWLMPTHELPWPAFHAEWAMAVAALVGTGGVLYALRGRIATMPTLAAVALLVATTPLLQLSVGIVRFAGDAILASLYLSSFAIMVIVGYHAARLWSGCGVLVACAWAVFLASLASSGMALCQWQAPDDLPALVNQLAPNARPYANLLQPNLLATLLVLGLVSVACLFDSRRMGAATSLLSFGLFSFGLVLTQSRAAWLELVVISLVVIAKRRVLTGRLRLRHLAVGALLLIVAQLAWTFLDPLGVQPVARDASETALSTGNRITHWHEMAVAISRHPWLGYGWMGVVSAQYDVAVAFPATHEVMGYSHNLVVDLLVCTGIPLGLAITGWLLIWLWRVVVRAADSTTLLAVAALMAMLTHAQVEYPLAYTYFLLPAGLLCGLLSRNSLPAAVRAVPNWMAPLLLACASATLVVVSIDYLEVEQQIRLARFDQARIGLDRPRPAASPIRVLTQLDALLRFGRTPERMNLTPSQLDEMRDVVVRFPSGSNMVSFAAALAMNQRPEEAAQVLQRVCKFEREAGCQSMKNRWAVLSRKQAAIQQVAWPP